MVARTICRPNDFAECLNKRVLIELEKRKKLLSHPSLLVSMKFFFFFALLKHVKIISERSCGYFRSYLGFVYLPPPIQTFQSLSFPDIAVFKRNIKIYGCKM